MDKTGGFAFPRPYSRSIGDMQLWDQEGMDLRDYIAARIAASGIRQYFNSHESLTRYVSFCYDVAEALIAERDSRYKETTDDKE